MPNDRPPLISPKALDESSVFEVGSLLREGRRQRGLADTVVPDVCVLDPDGDIVRWLSSTDQARLDPNWACYHSELWRTQVDGRHLGIVPCAVGGPYAVLVAEELHASGCGLLISVTSAGRILPVAEPPYFVLIERAWRDEGTSFHYLAPSAWSVLKPDHLAALEDAFSSLPERVLVGASWTTDAPFRETPSAIAAAEDSGILAVEMEAAGLYAYAEATRRDVVCAAHVTNTMAVDGDDFEKGDHGGARRTLDLIGCIVARLAAAPT